MTQINVNNSPKQKKNKRKETKIRVEINKMKNKKKIEKINKTSSLKRKIFSYTSQGKKRT